MTDILAQLTRTTRQIEHAQRGLAFALDDRREILAELHRIARNLIVDRQGGNEHLFPSTAQLENFYSWLSGTEGEVIPFQHSLEAGVPDGRDYDVILRDARPSSSPRRSSVAPIASSSRIVEEDPALDVEQISEDTSDTGAAEEECASPLHTNIAILSDHPSSESSFGTTSEDEGDELVSE